MDRRILTIVACFCLAASGARPQDADPVIAQSREFQILRGEVLDRLLQDWGRVVTDDIVVSVLLAQKAAAAGVTVDPNRVVAILSDIEAALPRGPDNKPTVTLDEYLAERGLTIGTALRRIHDKLLTDALIEREITVPDEAIRKRFEQQRELLKRPERRLIVYAGFETEADARAAIAELRAGKRLEGDKEAMVILRDTSGPVVKAVFAWPPPDPQHPFERVTADPIALEGKFYVARLDRVYPPEPDPKLEDHYQEIRAALVVEERERRRGQWLEDLRKQAEVKILFEL